MTEHDIRRAHALWLHLKQAYTDLGAIAGRWEQRIDETGSYREAAAELRAYLAKWKKPVQEGEP